mgnify:CR=1 FL=1
MSTATKTAKTAHTTFANTAQMRAIVAGIAANVPVIVWGNPGVAKTAKITSWARSWGHHTETIVGGNREATDFLGHPYVDDEGVTRYTDLRWARDLRNADATAPAGKGLLILDEFTTAAPSTQKGMLRVLEERYVGDFHLGDHVAIVAIANPPENGADAYDLPAPSANRLMHISWVFDRDEWFNGVATEFNNTSAPKMLDLIAGATPQSRARAYQQVTAFLRHRPELLNPEPPKDAALAGKAWPSPRMWTKAIAVLAELHERDDMAAAVVVEGCVGEGAATEFIAWTHTADLHDPVAVMSNPGIVNWFDERPDRLFALCGAVTMLATTSGTDNPVKAWEAGCQVMRACATAGKPDVAAPFMLQLNEKKPAEAAFADDVLDAFIELFTDMGIVKAA